MTYDKKRHLKAYSNAPQTSGKIFFSTEDPYEKKFFSTEDPYEKKFFFNRGDPYVYSYLYKSNERTIVSKFCGQDWRTIDQSGGCL